MSQGLEIDYSRRELRRGGAAVPLGQRAFDVLAALARASGEVVSKDELMALVWGGTVVEENALQAHISAIRRALGPDREVLKTISGRGYSLQLDWREDPAAPDKTQRISEPRAELSTQSNLPQAAAMLIGRAEAVDTLKSMLQQSRILTITGPGGIGKTALSLQVTRDIQPWLQGPAYFVDLASVLEPVLVASAAARAMGLRTGAATISPSLVADRVGAARLLLVLDNCEHLIESVADFTETLIRTCGNVRILTTSREPLRVEGEYIYRVAPLEVPAKEAKAPDEIYSTAAAQLFVTRMRAANSDAALGNEQALEVANICRQLDGIPLAIEFAAARAAVLGVAPVATNLDDRFQLLTGGRRTALPRQQTLRATLDWSYELLPDFERFLLRHLAVFPGGFTVDAAAAVLSDPGQGVAAVLDQLANLVAKSLVIQDPAPGRWRLPETVRSYALEKLTERGEAGGAYRRQAAFLLALCASDGSRALGPLRPANLGYFAAEIDNVRAGLDWCFSPAGDRATGVALTAAYGPVWQQLALIAECRERTGRAIERWSSEEKDDPRLLMQLSLQHAVATGYALQPKENTRKAALRALAIAERLDDLGGQLQSLYFLWASDLLSGEVRRALGYAERFRDSALRMADEVRIATAERVVGHALQMNGNHRVAQDLLESSLAKQPPIVPREYSTWTRFDERAMARAVLANSYWLRGDLDRAIHEAYGALEDALADTRGVSRCIVLHLAVCRIDIAIGRYEAAKQSTALLTEIATRHDLQQYLLHGIGFDGALLVKCGEFERGIAALRRVLEAGTQTGWATWFPELLGMLAEGLLHLDRFDEAEAAISDGIARSESGETWYLPELLRMQGEIASRRPGAAAEDCFRQAISMAHEQGALFWELRAALSLARLKRRQDRAAEARQALGPVYARFTEGLATPDLRAARDLLASL